MCMRPTPGCGTLDSPSLVLPVSLLLKQRRSARGHSAASLQGCSCKERLEDQASPQEPECWWGRPMQTYDMYIPVIYLSYPLDQWKMFCLHWCQPICLGCVFGMHGLMCAGCFIVFWLFKSTKCKFHIWPTYSTPNQLYVRYNLRLLQWFQHCNFRTDYLSSLQASIYQCTRPMEWIHALKPMKS